MNKLLNNGMGQKKAQWKTGMIALFIFAIFISFGSGMATAADSSVAVQSVASGGGGSSSVYGDVNGDGALDAADAILILQKIVGIIDKFPVEANIPPDTIIVEHVLAMQFTVNYNGDYYLHYLQYDGSETSVINYYGGTYSSALPGNAMVYKLSSDCTFTGGSSILDMIEHFVTLQLNDDGEITNIAISGPAVVGPVLADNSILKSINVVDGKAQVGGISYNILPADQVAKEGVFPTEFTLNGSVIADGTYNSSDAYRLILNEDGNIAGIVAYTAPTPGIVQEVVGQSIIYMDNAAPKSFTANFTSYAGSWQGYSNQSNFRDMDIFVERDGKPATLADIKPLDTVNVLQGYRGNDYYLKVSSQKVSGTLDAAVYSGTDVKKLRVNGQEWAIPYTNFNFLAGVPKFYSASYSVDGGNLFEGNLTAATLDSEYELWNEPVTLLLGPNGKVTGLISNKYPCGSEKYGVITEITSPMAWTDGTTVRNIKVLQADGKEYSYPISDDTFIRTGVASTIVEDIATLSTIDDLIMSKDAGTPTITAGSEKLVGVSLKANGLVDRIDVINQADQMLTIANIDTDNKLVKIAGAWVDASDVVVFNLNHKATIPPAPITPVGPANNISDLGDTKVVGWDELKNAAFGVSFNSWYVNEYNQLEYLVVNACQITSGDKYAIYKGFYSDADDWVTFVGQEPIKCSALPAGITKGDVVHYTLSGNEAFVDAKSVPYGTSSNFIITSLGSNWLELNDGTNYKLDADTAYLDVSDINSLTVLTKPALNDQVIVIADASDPTLAAAVVIVGHEPLLLAPANPGVVFNDNDNSKTYSAGDTIDLIFNMDINDLSVSNMSAFVLDDPDSVWDSSMVQKIDTRTYRITLGNNGNTLALYDGDVIMVQAAYTNETRNVYFELPTIIPAVYGVITEITSPMAWTDGTTTVRYIKVMQKDGKEYSYPISDNTYVKLSTGINTKIKDLTSTTLYTIDDLIMSKDAGTPTITAGSEKLVGVTSNTNGLVDQVDVINQADLVITAAHIDTDNKLVNIAGTWVDASNVVVFNLNHKTNIPPAPITPVGPANNISDLGDTKVVGWDELKNAAFGVSLNAWYVNEYNQLEYLIVNAPPMTTGIKYAIYQERYSNSDDWVKFVGHDPNLLESSLAGMSKGDVVAYTLSGNVVNIFLRAVPYGAASGISVYKNFGSVIQLSDGTTWKVDSDTVYLDNSNVDNLKVLTGVAIGDVVKVISDPTDPSLAAAIVVAKYDGTAPGVSTISYDSNIMVTIQMTEALNPTTVNTTTVIANGTSFTSVYYASKAIVINYSSVPINGDRIILTTGIKDTAGNPLKTQVVLTKGTNF